MNTFSRKLYTAQTLVKNAVATGDVWYVVESANWAIRSVGEQIARELDKQALAKTIVTTSPKGIQNSLVHFGSLPAVQPVHPSNRTIATVFHIASDKHKQKIKDNINTIDRFHTASTTTAHELEALGIPENKITVIPLGVDTTIFKPVENARAHIRRELNIPSNTIVIGSFQKDGVGWGAGLKPKPEKGPDVLVQTVRRLANQHPVHVLLVGPARGYVAEKLAQLDISFTNIGYVKKLEDVARYYAALDLYLIAARVEGGPLSLLEAWASHIPVVTTNVGMVPDLARHLDNALVSRQTNVDQLAQLATKLIASPDLAHRLVANAQRTIQSLAWGKIVKRYHEDLYTV